MLWKLPLPVKRKRKTTVPINILIMRFINISPGSRINQISLIIGFRPDIPHRPNVPVHLTKMINYIPRWYQF
jgi:hypothetical protein